MATLFDAPRCPYGARVRIALAEKGLEYDTVDSFVVPKSAVINEYLEELLPEPALLPPAPEERAAVRLLLVRHDDFTRLYYALRRGEEGASAAFATALASLDGTLSHAPYLGGAAFGLVDVVYVPWVIRARDLLGVSLAPYPAVDSWLERLSDRPSIAAGIAVVAAL